MESGSEGSHAMFINAPTFEVYRCAEQRRREDLLNAAGELSIYHSRLSQQISSIEFHIEELEQTVSRLRQQLRKLEIETEAQIMHGHQDTFVARDFDPLEMDRYSNIQQLSRALAESANDIGSLKDLMRSLTSEAETLLVQQSRVTAELQEPVAIFSLEMSSVQLVNRLISAEAQLESEKIKKGNLADYEWEQLTSKITKLTDAPIYIDDTPALSIFPRRGTPSKPHRLRPCRELQPAAPVDGRISLLEVELCLLRRKSPGPKFSLLKSVD